MFAMFIILKYYNIRYNIINNIIRRIFLITNMPNKIHNCLFIINAFHIGIACSMPF